MWVCSVVPRHGVQWGSGYGSQALSHQRAPGSPCGELKALCTVPLPVRHCMALYIITQFPKIKQLVVSHSCTSKVLGSQYTHPKQGSKQPAEELLSWLNLQAGQGNRNSSGWGHQAEPGTQWLKKCWRLCRNVFWRNHLKYAPGL